MELDNNRKVQLLELDLLKTFASICESEGLRYYLLGGTLIGAIRHHGFIPWDDDIDVGMPREDYKRFLSVAGKYLEKGQKLLHYSVDKHTPYYFAKLLNTSVCLVIQGEHSQEKQNCWIDVFPIDGTPDNKLLRWKHLRVLDYYKMLLSFSRIKNLSRCEDRPNWKKAIYYMAGLLGVDRYVDSVKVKRAMDKHLSKYKMNCCVLSGNHVGLYREREFVPTGYFGQGSNVEFEGELFCAPLEADKYLRHVYGDYMQLPPEEKRVSNHHVIEILFTEH